MSTRLILTIILASAALSLAVAQNYPAVPPAPAKVKTMYGVNMQKSMAKLTSGQPFKLCYFGQSLCDDGQTWTHDFPVWLKKTFPKASITAVNKSQWGCDSDCLQKLVRERLSGVNADLIIMQDHANSEASGCWGSSCTHTSSCWEPLSSSKAPRQGRLPWRPLSEAEPTHACTGCVAN